MDYQLGPGPLQVDQNTTDEKIKGDIGIVENGDIATHAILKDYYVIWKGDLYKAKTDISSGTTLSAESNGNLDPKSNGLGGEVAALNSKMINVSLLAPSSITTSVTSYNLTDDFTKYQMLFINLKYQGICLNSVIVPSSLFSSLTSSSACVQLQSGETTIQVYKHTNTSVYMAASAATQNLRIEIIGFLAY